MQMNQLKVVFIMALFVGMYSCQDTYQSNELNIPPDLLEWEITNVPSGKVIPNQYIVIFNDNTHRVIGSRSIGLEYA